MKNNIIQGFFPDIEKSLPIGSIQEWQGRKFIKLPDGTWKPYVYQKIDKRFSPEIQYRYKVTLDKNGEPTLEKEKIEENQIKVGKDSTHANDNKPMTIELKLTPEQGKIYNKIFKNVLEIRPKDVYWGENEGKDEMQKFWKDKFYPKQGETSKNIDKYFKMVELLEETKKYYNNPFSGFEKPLSQKYKQKVNDLLKLTETLSPLFTKYQDVIKKAEIKNRELLRQIKNKDLDRERVEYNKLSDEEKESKLRNPSTPTNIKSKQGEFGKFSGD